MCIDKEPNNNVRGKKSPSSPSTSKEQSKNKRDGEKKKETAKIPSNSAKKETAKIPSNSVGKEDIVAKENVTKEKPEDEQSG
jgi:hypothetical protein